MYPSDYEFIEVAPRSKKPAHSKWTTIKPLSWTEAKLAIKDGLNTGCRLRDCDLVVDVDPRNFKDGLEAEFIKKLERVRAPRVDTPSGGTHVYFSKPPGLKLRHTVPTLPGIEFKSRGRQVVAPGSTHPNGAMYDWCLWSEPFPAPPVPDWLIEYASQEPAVAPVAGIVEWNGAKLAQVLAALPVTEFKEHDTWLRVMAASHEATGGDGVEEFVAWSCADPDYAADEQVIRARWASFKAGKDGNAGTGTLLKLLADRGRGDAAPDCAAADFAGAPDGGLVNDTVDEGPMARLTREYVCVDEDGRLRVFGRRKDQVLGRDFWVRYSGRDFLEVCESVLMLPMIEQQRGDKTVAVPAGELWLKRAHDKRTYRGLTFAPEHSGERTPDGRLNLWRGFAVEPSPAGSWSLLQGLVLETICDMDAKSYDYVMNWMARAVQRPHEPGGVALVMKGPKGAGKGTLGRAFCALFGQHGLHVASPDLITGRFNAHLRDCVALFADEAFWAGDKTGESKLKAIVTEPALAFEGKGQNAEMGRNCIHVIMASNSEWVVPAGLTRERRFAVLECADDARSAKFWHDLRAQMEDGGLERMLHDLLARDLSRFNVFDIPVTEALVAQKLRTMELVEQWMYELAQSDDWLGLPVIEWSHGRAVILCEEVQASLLHFYRDHSRARAGVETVNHHLGKALARVFPDIKRRRWTGERRPYVYIMPTAETARERFDQLLGILPK